MKKFGDLTLIVRAFEHIHYNSWWSLKEIFEKATIYYKTIVMNNTQKELSWFKLSLLHLLYESHPELTEDTNFLNARGDNAAETYSQAIRNGHCHQEAEERAQDSRERRGDSEGVQ